MMCHRRPSLRCGNRSVVVLTAPRDPHASSRQPQPESPQPLHSSRFTDNADVVPIGATGAPEPSTALSNCTNTESLYGLLPSAFNRIQSLYSCVGSAGNPISM